MAQNRDNYFNDLSYPSVDEIKSAQNACCGICCLSCETPAAYAWRKRDIDMSKLLDIAIDRELTELERRTVKEHWFEQKSVASIAAERGVSYSTVDLTLSRANKKLKNVLSYVVMYQHNICDISIVPLSLARARVISASRNSSVFSLGERLKLLRFGENISRKKLSELIDVSERRIALLECSSALPDADELEKIAAFFDISLNYLIKGEN